MSSRIKSLLLAVSILLNFPLHANPQSQGTDCRSCGVVERALRDFQRIKVGMARRDVERFFIVAGGMTFRNHTSYVYRDCDYLRVDVDFKADTETENAFSPDDKITGTSQITVAYPAKDSEQQLSKSRRPREWPILNFAFFAKFRVGMLDGPEDWQRSSFRHYANGAEGRVEVESEWKARKRERAAGMLCPAVELPHSSQNRA